MISFHYIFYSQSSQVQQLFGNTMSEQNQFQQPSGQLQRDYLIPENSPDIQQQQSDKEIAEGRWSNDQHLLFLAGLMKLGKDWKELQKVIRSRTSSQVRSHAQKYFLKLNKIQKERKKNRNKLPVEPTELESEILQMFQEADITSKTPQEIIHVLRQEHDCKKNLSCAKKLGGPTSHKQRAEEVEMEEKVYPKGSKGARNQNQGINFLSKYEEQEDQSYLLSLMKNHKNFDGKFEIKNFVDFGKHGNTQHFNVQTDSMKQQLPCEQVQVVGMRKKSFTLFDLSEDDEGEEKLKLTLEKVRNGS